jgi:hypothetical protein
LEAKLADDDNNKSSSRAGRSSSKAGPSRRGRSSSRTRESPASGAGDYLGSKLADSSSNLSRAGRSSSKSGPSRRGRSSSRTRESPASGAGDYLGSKLADSSSNLGESASRAGRSSSKSGPSRRGRSSSRTRESPASGAGDYLGSKLADSSSNLSRAGRSSSKSGPSRRGRSSSRTRESPASGAGDYLGSKLADSSSNLGGSDGKNRSSSRAGRSSSKSGPSRRGRSSSRTRQSPASGAGDYLESTLVATTSTTASPSDEKPNAKSTESSSVPSAPSSRGRSAAEQAGAERTERARSRSRTRRDDLSDLVTAQKSGASGKKTIPATTKTKIRYVSKETQIRYVSKETLTKEINNDESQPPKKSVSDAGLDAPKKSISDDGLDASTWHHATAEKPETSRPVVTRCLSSDRIRKNKKGGNSESYISARRRQGAGKNAEEKARKDAFKKSMFENLDREDDEIVAGAGPLMRGVIRAKSGDNPALAPVKTSSLNIRQAPARAKSSLPESSNFASTMTTTNTAKLTMIPSGSSHGNDAAKNVFASTKSGSNQGPKTAMQLRMEKNLARAPTVQSKILPPVSNINEDSKVTSTVDSNFDNSKSSIASVSSDGSFAPDNSYAGFDF